MATKHTAVFPDGEVMKRTSAHRVYEYAWRVKVDGDGMDVIHQLRRPGRIIAAKGFARDAAGAGAEINKFQTRYHRSNPTGEMVITRREPVGKAAAGKGGDQADAVRRVRALRAANDDDERPT